MEEQADLGNSSSTASHFSNPLPQSINSRQRTYPAILHVAVLSTFLLPVAFLPYFAARRQIVALQRKVEYLEKDILLFKSNTNAAVSHHASITSAQLNHLREMGLHTKKKTSELEKRVIELEANRIAADEEIRSDLRRLLNDTQHSRTQTATLRALGMTLADIAAFMQEVELNFGLGQRHDQRGIERMRLLALRMQSLSQPEDHTHQGSQKLPETSQKED